MAEARREEGCARREADPLAMERGGVHERSGGGETLATGVAGVVVPHLNARRAVDTVEGILTRTGHVVSLPRCGGGLNIRDHPLKAYPYEKKKGKSNQDKSGRGSTPPPTPNSNSGKQSLSLEGEESRTHLSPSILLRNSGGWGAKTEIK